MKYLVDTCGWLEYLTSGPLSEIFTPYFADLGQLLVPTVVQCELFKWVNRERDEAAAWDVIGVTEQCEVAALDTATALLAADLSQQHQLAMADAMIYAFAKKHKVTLLTCDRHFEGLASVNFFAK